MARSNNIFGGDDDKPTTLDGILGSILVFISLLLLSGGIALANRQDSAKERAEEIETKYCLERGPNKDMSESVPKGQYWYAWLATKARGVTIPSSTLNQGGIVISMPSLPPPPYLTGNGKSTIAPAQYYTTTQPTGPATAPPMRARGILATGDIDENGHWVISTARCRPYDFDGNHAGVAANTKGAEPLFHRVAAHAFVDPDAKPGARLEVRFPESIVAPADTQEIDEGLETVNKVVAAKRPSLLVLRLFSVLVLVLWLGGIAIFLNATLAKSNDGMWVTGPMHWPGKKQQQGFGLVVFMLGWLVLLVGAWYEMRMAIATRLAVAQLNHPSAKFRWHFCMPSPAPGHPRSFVLSPLRIGHVPTMIATLFLACASGDACDRCCDSNKKDQSANDGKEGQQTESIWETWAEPLETEWIISVRASPPTWYVPPPVTASQLAPATGYPSAPATGFAPTPVSESALANVTAFAARPVASLW